MAQKQNRNQNSLPGLPVKQYRTLCVCGGGGGGGGEGGWLGGCVCLCVRGVGEGQMEIPFSVRIDIFILFLA